ncbi:MAG: S9 family peptidase [Micavibrio sp.]|nr:MAG: S9 family peptidase [Micavibrio sp.]
MCASAGFFKAGGDLLDNNQIITHKKGHDSAMAQPEKKKKTPQKIKKYLSKAGENARDALKHKKIRIGSPPPSVEALKRALNPPHDDTVETLHGYQVHDHFRPLEKIDDKTVTDWIDRQNEKFQDYIKGSDTAQKSVRRFMAQMWNRESESIPAAYGKYAFTHYNDGRSNHAVFQVRPKDDPEAKPRVLIDPNKIDPTGKTALSGAFPSPDGKRVAYLLSENGSDAKTLYVMDTKTGQHLADKIDGFRFGNVAWDKDGKGFHYGYPMNDAKKRSFVKHHTLGADVKKDKTVFEPKDAEMASAGFFRPRHSKHDWISTHIGTNPKNGLYYRPSGTDAPFKKLIDDGIATVSPVAEIDGKIYTVTKLDAPKGRLVRFELNDPAPEKWETLIAEDANDTLESAFVHQGRLFVTHSHDTADRLKVHDLDGKFQYDVKLPLPLALFSIAKFTAQDKKLVFSISNDQQSGNRYEYDVAKNDFKLLKKNTLPYDLTDCVVERITATSKDGTKVPMTVIRHPDTKLDGSAAVKLYGYGGFDIPLTPAFSAGMAHWVKNGGIYVRANLRGGGEYGQDWYDQGRCENKQNVFDDFIACAEHLVKKKYTNPKRIAIEGGSNGGLLTAATVLQRPDLFGAVISAVPVIDMFRFQLGTYGAAWKSDYGDPSIKKDFETAARYSPLHNVKNGAKFPPVLIKTGDHDDRVLPWHAYKFAATMQAHGHPENQTLLRVSKNTGHGAGKSQQDSLIEIAETHAFLEKALGPIDQNAYKAALMKQAAADHGAKGLFNTLAQRTAKLAENVKSTIFRRRKGSGKGPGA